MPPFQRVIGLVEINKYIIQDLLLQDCNILGGGGLQGGRTCSSLSSEAMQNIVDLGGFRQATFNAYCYKFPEHLHQAYSTVLASAIGDKDDVGLLLVISK